MNKTKSRRHFTPEQKADIVRRHMAGKEAVSDLADELDVQPSQIHTWVKQVLDHAPAAFQQPRAARRAGDVKDRKIAHLETKLATKNEVLAELMEAHVQLKKELGEP